MDNLDIHAQVEGYIDQLIQTKGSSYDLFTYHLEHLKPIQQKFYFQAIVKDFKNKIDAIIEDVYREQFEDHDLIAPPRVIIDDELKPHEDDRFNAFTSYAHNENYNFIDRKTDDLKKILEYSLAKLTESNIKKADAPKDTLKFVVTNTFNWIGGEELLRFLYDELVKGFISDIGFDTFKLAFSNTSTKQALNIPWIKISRKKLSNKQALFYLFDQLNPEYMDYALDAEHYTTFSNVFCDVDGNCFTGLKQAMGKYNDQGLRDKKVIKQLDELIEKLKDYHKNGQVR